MQELEITPAFLSMTRWLAGLSPQEIVEASTFTGSSPGVLARLASYEPGTIFCLRSDVDVSRFLCEEYLTQSLENFFEIFEPDDEPNDSLQARGEAWLLGALSISSCSVVGDCMSLSESAANMQYVMLTHIHVASEYRAFESQTWFNPLEPFAAGTLATLLLEGALTRARRSGQNPIPLHPFTQFDVFRSVWASISPLERRSLLREISLIADNLSIWVFEPMGPKPPPPQAQLSLFDQFFRLALSHNPSINTRARLKAALYEIEARAVENAENFLARRILEASVFEAFSLEFVSATVVLEQLRQLCERKAGAKEPSLKRYVLAPKVFEALSGPKEKAPLKKKKNKKKKQLSDSTTLSQTQSEQLSVENFVPERTESEFFGAISIAVANCKTQSSFEQAILQFIPDAFEPKYDPNVSEEYLRSLFEPESINATQALEISKPLTFPTPEVLETPDLSVPLTPQPLSSSVPSTPQPAEVSTPGVEFVEAKKETLGREARTKRSRLKRSANESRALEGAVNTRKRRSERIRPVVSQVQIQDAEIENQSGQSPPAGPEVRRPKLNYNPQVHSFDPFHNFPAESLITQQLELQIRALTGRLRDYAAEMSRPNHSLIFLLERIISDVLGRKFTLSIYGSFATGLFTPLSDIDLSLELDPPLRSLSDAAQLLHQIAESLLSAPIDLQVTPILSAVVPVVKLQCSASALDPSSKPSTIKCDISAAIRDPQSPISSCSETTAFLLGALKDQPVFSGAISLFKFALGCLSLIDTYKGGVNSFGLALVCIAALRRYSPDKNAPFSASFLKILRFVAREFDPARQYIDLNSEEVLLPLNGELEVASQGILVLDPTVSKPKNALPFCSVWARVAAFAEGFLQTIEGYTAEVRRTGAEKSGEERLFSARNCASKLMKTEQGPLDGAVFELLGLKRINGF